MMLFKRKTVRFITAGLIAIILLFTLVIVMQSKSETETKKYNGMVPEKYIPIYQRAAKKYNISWFLLAAVHRVETKFSTAEPMISKVGALGPMQFMPCSFVGWSEKSCPATNGQGNIPNEKLTDPQFIKKHGGYGVDANGDGKADPWDLEDAIFSTAHFLADNGAKDGNEAHALYTYNHSEKYVKTILSFKKKYEKEWQQSH